MRSLPKVVDGASYIAHHAQRREQWAAEEREAQQLGEDAREKRRVAAEEAERERVADLARRRERLAERQEEVRPWLEKLAELRQLAEQPDGAVLLLAEGDVDGAIDAMLRREAAARLVPRFVTWLESKFPYPVYLTKFSDR